MKIYNIFNSRKQLLASFISTSELFRFIVRHCRTVEDTTILTTEADAWNEMDDIKDETKELIGQAWDDHSKAWQARFQQKV